MGGERGGGQDRGGAAGDGRGSAKEWFLVIGIMGPPM